MPGAPLATVVRHRGRSLGGIHPPRRVPDTIQGSPSSPHWIPGPVSNLTAGFGACSHSPRGDRHHGDQRGSGNSFRPRPWFLQPPLPSGEIFRRLASRNRPLQQTTFRMETPNSVLLTVRKNDFLASIDLKDTYFQIPVHPSSRKLLRFVSNDTVYQFKALCFGLSIAPQVFTRVFASVSSWAHARGIRLLRYMDDWLILSTSRIKTRQHVDQFLSFCRSLGIVINTEKSNLSPSRSVEYLGMIIDTVSAQVFPTEARIQKFLWQGSS